MSKFVVAVWFHRLSPIHDHTQAGHVAHCAQVFHCIHWGHTGPVAQRGQLSANQLMKLYTSPLVASFIVPLASVPKTILFFKLFILILPPLTSSFSCG